MGFCHTTSGQTQDQNVELLVPLPLVFYPLTFLTHLFCSGIGCQHNLFSRISIFESMLVHYSGSTSDSTIADVLV
jgi:hypothetical protein